MSKKHLQRNAPRTKARKPARMAHVTRSEAKPKTATNLSETPEPTPIRVTAKFARVWDGRGGISEDAELGDVLMEMFTDCYSGDEEPKISFLDAVVRSIGDDLAMLELAQSAGNICEEAPRILERTRARLIVARWLDARTTVLPEPAEVSK